MKTSILVTLSLIACLGETRSALGEITSFNYHGRLNQNGNLANGFYDLWFSLHDDPTGGNNLGLPLTNSAVAVSNGLFTTVLDFGQGPFDGRALWLQIAMRTNGGGSFSALTPRQPLTPVPYALHAANAGSVFATGILGTVPDVSLSANVARLDDPRQVFAGANIFNNPSNAFTGDGTGLVGVNAWTLRGLGPASFWQTGGNAGTTPGADFLGTLDAQPLELRANNSRGLRLDYVSRPLAPPFSGSYGGLNVVGGAWPNFVSAGVIGATIAGGGLFNDTLADPAGDANAVSGDYGTVGGGIANRATLGATVSGGIQNTASGASANVAGGEYNQASGDRASVGGGSLNEASGPVAAVAGGTRNRATMTGAFIGGGTSNLVSGTNGVIGGGLGSQVTAAFATVAGGSHNQAAGLGAFVGGGGGDPGRDEFGGIISFGNVASGNHSTIGAGSQNTASGLHSTVGGGSHNSASGTNAVVAGGVDNEAFGTAAAVVGGSVNRANGDVSAALGGYRNEANGFCTFAAGNNAHANHDRSFVWSSYADPAPSFVRQRFHVLAFNGLSVDYNTQRANGGGSQWVVIGGVEDFPGTVIQASNGAQLTAGGMWQNASDRNRKTDLVSVDPQAVLEKVAALPLHFWRYTNEVHQIRHLGPMAQDFQAAFGLGTDERAIGTGDADGVALAAIQGLNQKLEAQRAALQTKEREISELKDRLAMVEAALAHLPNHPD